MEARLVRKICKALEAQGCYVRNIHGNAHTRAGTPDIIGCYQGLFFGFEVKLPNRRNTVTDLQKLNLKKIRHAGGIAAVVTSPEEALGALGVASP